MKKKSFLILLLITLTGMYSACEQKDSSRGMRDIQKEDEIDRDDVIEKDTFSDDRKMRR